MFSPNAKVTLMKSKKKKNKLKRLDWFFSPVRAYMVYKLILKEKGIIELPTENNISVSDTSDLKKTSSSNPSIEQADKQSTTDNTSKLGTAS